MSDARAGLVKVAAVTVTETPHIAAIAAGGDQWVSLAGARIDTLALKPATPGGDAQSVTRIRLADGRTILTAEPIADEGDPEAGLLGKAEAAQAAIATTQFQPLVDQLEARTPQEPLP
jgi:hypothetical protein